MAVNKKGKSGSEGSKKKEDSTTAERAELKPSESKEMPVTKVGNEATEDDKTKSSSSSSKSGNKSAEAKFMPDDAGPKKQKEKGKEDKAPFAAQITDFLQYLREVQIEFRKISWPESGEVIRATYSVLFLVAVITLLVLGFDFAIGKVFFGPLEHWARMLGGGIGRG